MAKKLTIQIEMDRSGAKAEAERFKQDSAKLNGEILANVQATEKGGAKAATDAAGVRLKATADVKETTLKATAETRDALGRFARASDDVGEHTAAAGKRGAAGLGEIATAAGLLSLAAGAAIKVLDDLGAAAARAGEKSKALSDKFAAERDSLRELQVLMGKEGQDPNKFTLDIAKFGKSTGMSKPGESRSFLTEMYNAGAAFEGKNISSPEFKQFGEQFAGLSVAKGIPAEQAGEMAGSILGFKDYTKFKDRASEQALATGNATLAGLGRGKGKAPVLANQFNMLASASLNEDAMRGTFQSPEEVAAVISIGAEKNDASAAETAKMAIRGLRSFDDKEAGPFLKRAGITPQTPFIEAVGKATPIFESEAKTSGVKVEDVIGKYFKDQGTKESLSVFANRGVSAGGFKDRLDFMAANAGPEKAQGVIADFQKSDVGARRIAEAEVEVERLQAAVKNSRVEIGRLQALAKLIRSGEIDTNATGINDYMNQKASFGAVGDPEQKRIDDEFQRMLMARAPAGTAPAPLMDLADSTPLGREKQLRERIEAIQAAGGDPLAERRDEEDFIKARRDDNAIGHVSREVMGGNAPDFAGPSPKFSEFRKPRPRGFATGGRVGPDAPTPKLPGTDPGYWQPQGTDTVPAMLAIDEHITNATSARANRAILEAIDRARGPIDLDELAEGPVGMAKGGRVPKGKAHRPVNALVWKGETPDNLAWKKAPDPLDALRSRLAARQKDIPGFLAPPAMPALSDLPKVAAPRMPVELDDRQAAFKAEADARIAAVTRDSEARQEKALATAAAFKGPLGNEPSQDAAPAIDVPPKAPYRSPKDRAISEQFEAAAARSAESQTMIQADRERLHAANVFTPRPDLKYPEPEAPPTAIGDMVTREMSRQRAGDAERAKLDLAAGPFKPSPRVALPGPTANPGLNRDAMKGPWPGRMLSKANDWLGGASDRLDKLTGLDKLIGPAEGPAPTPKMPPLPEGAEPLPKFAEFRAPHAPGTAMPTRSKAFGAGLGIEPGSRLDMDVFPELARLPAMGGRPAGMGRGMGAGQDAGMSPPGGRQGEAARGPTDGEKQIVQLLTEISKKLDQPKETPGRGVPPPLPGPLREPYRFPSR
jgi:hypothetical protein